MHENVKNARFHLADVYTLNFESDSVDFFLFNASLHHFRNIESFISSKIKPAIKKGGLIIINEYVGPNRMNFPKEQMSYADQCLNKIIARKHRKIMGLNRYKTKCYRLGKIRMFLSDPSECVDSAAILPVLRKEFSEIELKNLGGNILMPVLKHIAHHFMDEGPHHEITELAKKEDEYLLNHPSDFVFAIYKKN
jgi:ubiquinone/menaquinone biosynthesis C-methylase UbiE